MSPAAIDLITLPPIEPPPSASAADAPRQGPSFQEHLQRAERRPQNSTNEQSADRPAAESTAAAQADARSQATENKSEADPQDAAAETDATVKSESNAGNGESDEKSEPDAAEPVVAAVAAPTTVDPTELVVADTVDITVAAAPEIVVEATAKPTAVADEAAAPLDATRAVVEVALPDEPTVPADDVAPTTLDDAKAPAKPVVATSENAAEQIADVAAANEPGVAESKPEPVAADAPVVSPLHATVTNAAKVAVEQDSQPTTEADAETEKAAVDTADSLPTVPNEPGSVQQVVAAVEAALDAAPSDERTSSKEDRIDPRGSDRTAESIRTDRPHGGEPTRHGGREPIATRGSSDDGPAPLSQADRVRLVERVARAVRTAEQRGGELKIRLSPPELGSLRLQLKLIDGTLSARIETETPEAQRVLIDNLPQLRERLSDQNIRVEKFDIDLFNSGYGGAPQHSREEYDRASEAAADRRNRVDLPAAAVDETASAAGRTARSDGRLDITV